MKKFYTLLVALILVGTISTQAQIKFGVKGGLNLPSLDAQGGINAVSADNANGWHAGLALELKLPIIGIEADVFYSQVGFESATLGSVTADLQNTTLDIPVVAKWYILKVLNIQAGPQFSFVTSSKHGVDDIKSQIDNKAFGFVAGLGVELGPLMASGRFIFPSTITVQNAGDYKTSNIQISVGYWFKK
jgi:outer membrane protein with beta-barrel domain